MKTAIILVGFVRTWDKVIHNFMETFAYMEPRVFVTTYDRQFGYHPHIRGLFKFHEDNFLTEEEIVNLFEPVNPRSLLIEKADDIDNFIKEEEANMADSMKGLSNCYGQFRKLFNACRDVEKYEQENDMKFDRIIKTRCDILYPDAANFDIGYDHVLIDNGNVFPNDCFFMAYRDKFMSVCEKSYNQFYNSLPNSNVSPPHQLLKNAFDASGLEIVPRKIMKSVMRASGEQIY